MSKPVGTMLLEPYEMMWAGELGVRTRINCLINDRKDTLGKEFSDSLDQWEIAIESRAAEAAFSKWHNVWWGGHINTFKDKRDAGLFEVRWAKHNSLILRPGDPPNEKHPFDLPYVFVTGGSLVYQIWGWIWGSMAKQTEMTDMGKPQLEKCWAIHKDDLIRDFTVVEPPGQEYVGRASTGG